MNEPSQPINQDPKAWREGYVAGLDGDTPQTPAGVDESAYQAGVVEGLAVAIEGGCSVDDESNGKDVR